VHALASLKFCTAFQFHFCSLRYQYYNNNKNQNWANLLLLTSGRKAKGSKSKSKSKRPLTKSQASPHTPPDKLHGSILREITALKATLAERASADHAFGYLLSTEEAGEQWYLSAAFKMLLYWFVVVLMYLTVSGADHAFGYLLSTDEAGELPIAAQSLRYRRVIASESLCSHSVVVSQPLRNHVAIYFQSLCIAAASRLLPNRSSVTAQ
jgi:hypothetical protein